MPEVELSAGTIEYEDTGGDGPVVLLLRFFDRPALARSIREFVRETEAVPS